MKHDHHNPCGLASLPFIVTLLGTVALLLAPSPAAGQFTEVDPGLAKPPFPCVVWGDYDGDGDLDVLVAGAGSHDIAFSTIYKNTGGTISDSGIVLLGLSRALAAWGDFDGDGDLDLAMTGLTTAGVPTTRICRNDGGVFTALTNNLLGVLGGSVTWVDYDNDGHLDLSLAGNENGLDLLSLYRNTTGTPNTIPSAPTNLAVNVLGTSVEFSWSAASDTQTPAAGLSYNLRVGTTPGGSQVVAPQSSSGGYRRLAALGSTGPRLAARLSSLKPGTNYFWSVQAVDTAFAGSPFAAEGSFTALADRPVTISIAREGPGSIRATWRGTPGSAYQVLSSTNLSAWSLFATPTAGTNGLFDIVDATAPAPAGYYRAARP
jgi:hypothetical protein